MVVPTRTIDVTQLRRRQQRCRGLSFQNAGGVTLGVTFSATIPSEGDHLGAKWQHLYIVKVIPPIIGLPTLGDWALWGSIEIPYVRTSTCLQRQLRIGKTSYITTLDLMVWAFHHECRYNYAFTIIISDVCRSHIVYTPRWHTLRVSPLPNWNEYSYTN